MKELSVKDGRLLAYLEDTKNWRVPPMSSMCKIIGTKSKGEVFRVLKKLQKSKLIDKDYKPKQL